MKKAKRILCMMISVVMLITVIASCGPKETTPTTPPSESASATPSAPASNSPAPETSATPDIAITHTPAPEEDVKYAEHIEIIIDNNRISVINPMEPGSNSTPTHWVMTMIYDRLLNYNETTSSFEPALATKWDTTDSKTFTFDLRDDVTFHNGEKFTAKDVVYTIQKSKEATGSMMASQWSPVETATAISDTKLELVLANVNVDFLMNIVQPMTGILNEKAINDDPENGPLVGTGAFKFVDFASNEFTTVERNDNYWGTAPITKSMKLSFIPEVSARATMIQNNEAQICFSIGVEDYDLFRSDDYSIFPLTMNNCQGMSFNMLNPITADPNFRKAVAYATDKAEIADLSSGEWGRLIDDGTIWGFATEFRNTSIPVVERDLDKAREYLAASSYNGEPVSISASISTNIKSAEVLLLQLADIGINCTVNETDSAGLNALFFNPDHHIIFHGITFTYSAGSSKHVFGTGGGQNRGSYSNPQVDALLTQAASENDATVRDGLYKEIQEIAVEEVPYINVYWRMNGIVGVKGVGGLKLPSDTNQTDLRNAYWIID